MKRSRTYLFSNGGRDVTWKSWRRMGGCGCSHWGQYEATPCLGPLAHWDKSGVTLGQIQDASVVAGRGLARFAREVLGRADLTVIEHDQDERQS